MKKNLPYIIIGLIIVVVFLSLLNSGKEIDKPAIKKESKAADRIIKAEQARRKELQKDSLRLANRAAELAEYNRSLEEEIEELKNKENEVRHIPVYTTDSEYNDFFAKRYGKKALPR